MIKKNLLPAKKNKNLPVPVVSDDNLSSYLNFVNNLPILSIEEEQELARRYRYKHDLDAAQQLVMAHLRFVTKLAKNLSGYNLSISDLIQEGNVGLMKAVSRFDPDQGVRLVSFAVHWIKAEMHDYVVRNWKIVKVATTKAQRKLFFNLRSIRDKTGWLSAEEVEQIANELGVKQETVIEMEKRMCQGDTSLDLPYKDSEGEDTSQQSLYLEDKSSNIENQVVEQDYYDTFKQVVNNTVSKLDPRAKDIIMSRYLLDEKVKLQDLAAKYKISAERVRQIEEEAMTKLKKAVKNNA